MEQFIVSARKYRPQSFESVVGQSHITNTLESAIANNHLAQALLFCGPRGVGKTTCARILAKKINESDHVKDSDFSLNVFELDAASNNSVDDIRNLIDQVRFAPQVGKYKVYIIDEVHMLSQQAFNAFLKTLEEPPAHAIFILATTEKHKIIPTILSRCQIFDFKRITVDDIAGHLAYVAEQENVKADPEGLHIIGQKADGALRDALSIFDKLVTFSDNNITYESVIKNLDILDYDYFFKATQYILEQNLSALLVLFSEILDKGFDGIQLVNGLAGHFRDLLVSKDQVTIELLEVGPSVKKRYLEQSKVCDMAFLIYALRILNTCDVQYKTSSNQRMLVEIALMDLVSLLEKKKLSQNVTKPTAQEIAAESKPQNKVAEQKITVAHTPVATRNNVVSEPASAPLKPETKAPEAHSVKHESPAEPSNTPQSSPEQNIVKKPSTNANWRTKLKGGTSGISIKSGAALQVNPKTTNDNKDEEEEITGPVEVFSDKAYEDAWKEYLERIKSKKSIFGILSLHKPKLKNRTEMHFVLDNKTQESYLQQEQTEMLAFLREKLQNYKLKVFTEINHVEIEKKPYTAEERYLAMVKVNPTLEVFRKALDMEID